MKKRKYSASSKTDGVSTVPLISILINFHGEGYIAQSTLKSALEARAEFLKRGIGDVEIVAVLDTPSKTTLRVVEANSESISKLHVVDFKDLAQSRNYGIRECGGEFVAFLDGDDLWSCNWLVAAFNFISSLDEPVILHTEYFISFGIENFARVQWDSEDFLFDPLTLMHNWHFCNNAFARRALLLDNPFVPYDHNSGFGSEDWHWSCETIARGVRHAPVPGTAYFYRMKDDVMALGGSGHQGLGAKQGLLVRPSKLFSPDNLHFDRKVTFVSDFLRVEESEGRFKEAPKALPEDIRRLWQRAGDIDPDCYPSNERLRSINIVCAPVHYKLATLFRRMMSQLNGVECLVFLEYRDSKEINLAVAKVISAQLSHRKVGVILMSNVPVGTDGCNEGLVLVPFWQEVEKAGLSGPEVVSLIARLILQIQPREVINLWSTYYAERVEQPYLKAFASIGISSRSLISGAGGGDIFSHGFRDDLVRFAYSNTERPVLTFSDKRAAEYYAERHRLIVSNVGYLDAGGKILSIPDKSDTSKAHSANVGSPIISCVLNAHREGLLLDSTISSIAHMMRYTTDTIGVECELVVIADGADQTTIDLLRAVPVLVDSPVYVHSVDLRDLGSARNHGVEQCRGKYVALLDADDLYCRDWLVRALQEFERDQDENLVIHPQYNVYFGREQRVFEHKPMSPDSDQRYALAFANYWTSLIFTTRQILTRFQFDSIRLNDGFGFEDWSWNIKSLKHGISHRVAPGTAHFIRLKANGSLNLASVDAGAVYHPAGLFREAGAQ